MCKWKKKKNGLQHQHTHTQTKSTTTRTTETKEEKEKLRLKIIWHNYYKHLVVILSDNRKHTKEKPEKIQVKKMIELYR